MESNLLYPGKEMNVTWIVMVTLEIEEGKVGEELMGRNPQDLVLY